MAQRTAPRVLIIGWDAADWKIIDPLLAVNRMPHLAGLVARGVRGDLSTLQPMLSPLLWTSVATGKTPDKHGILNFIEPEPAGGLRVATSTTRRAKALWNILTQAGLRAEVIGWYATHPAEPIAGTIVSNLFLEGAPPGHDAAWPPVPGSIHPPASAAAVAGLRMHPGEVTAAELFALVPRLREMDPTDRRVHLLARLIAHAASIQNVATSLLVKRAAHCTMVFFETIDVAGHHFMQYHPPRMPHVSEHDFGVFGAVMPAVYEFQDLMLGRLLELAGPETAVILLSDHGFHSDHLRPAVSPSPDDAMAAMDASWHRPLGVLVMAGPGIKRGERVYGANILDITPTALTLLGLPVGADMDGRVLVEAFEREPVIERVFSWDGLEGDPGMHPADLRLDPVEAASTMRQLADLGYISAPTGDTGAELEALARETKFNLGIVLMSTRRVPESISIWEELAAAVPNEPRYVLNLAQCYHNVGRYAESRQLLSRFLEAHPGHADARIHLGVALFAEGCLDEAGMVLEQLERETPGRVDLDTLLGTVYIFLRRYEDARRVFARAAVTDPHDPRAHHGLALVALNTGQYEPAAEHCLTALDLQHFYPDAHYTLGVALTWMGEHRHAVRSFQVAVSMQPGMIDAHRYLASLYRHLGDRQNAPRHRDIAQRLIDDRAAGQLSPEHFMRSAPMGPQDWENSLGLGGA